jgi:phage shock protein A
MKEWWGNEEGRFMSKEEIQKAIARLKTEIDTLDADKAAVKKRLNSLIRDLERQLEHADEVDHGPMIERMGSLVEQFETEHPTITGILNGIMTSLSNMGI